MGWVDGEEEGIVGGRGSVRRDGNALRKSGFGSDIHIHAYAYAHAHARGSGIRCYATRYTLGSCMGY